MFLSIILLKLLFKLRLKLLLLIFGDVIVVEVEVVVVFDWLFIGVWVVGILEVIGLDGLFFCILGVGGSCFFCLLNENV